jgi:hypothetical protein
MTRLIQASGKGDEMLEIECRHCSTKRRFKMSLDFTLYSEREPVETAPLQESRSK